MASPKAKQLPFYKRQGRTLTAYHLSTYFQWMKQQQQLVLKQKKKKKKTVIHTNILSNKIHDWRCYMVPYVRVAQIGSLKK